MYLYIYIIYVDSLIYSEFLRKNIIELSTKLLSQCQTYVYNAADKYITPAI